MSRPGGGSFSSERLRPASDGGAGNSSSEHLRPAGQNAARHVIGGPA
jgi:hypothetical protein